MRPCAISSLYATSFFFLGSSLRFFGVKKVNLSCGRSVPISFRTTLCTSIYLPCRGISTEGSSSPSFCNEKKKLFYVDAATYANRFKMVLLRRALEQQAVLASINITDGGQCTGETFSSNSFLLKRCDFDKMCALCSIENSEEALIKLESSGLVVRIEVASGECFIHVRPATYRQEIVIRSSVACWGKEANQKLDGSNADDTVNSATPSSKLNFSLPPLFLESEVQKRVDMLEIKEKSLSDELKEATNRVARRGRRRLLGAAFMITLQIVVVGRLTFYELDWDTLEPITYCFSLFTTLIFYLFFVRRGREYSLKELHRSHASKFIRRWAPKTFDWERYEAVRAQLVEEKMLLKRIREWGEQH